MAVSSSSIKVARVTVTAMIQGLIPGRDAATFGKEMESVVALIRCPISWMQQETARSHLIYGTMKLATGWSRSWFRGT